MRPPPFRHKCVTWPPGDDCPYWTPAASGVLSTNRPSRRHRARRETAPPDHADRRAILSQPVVALRARPLPRGRDY